MFKKIALNIFLVICVVYLMDLILGRALRFFYFKETSGLHFRTNYAIDSTKAEVLIFGSSRANHSYVPDVFEDSLKTTFYNTGRDGNGIFYQTALLETIVKRYTPKIVVLEYSGFDKNQIGFDKVASLLPYYKTNPDIKKIVDLEEPTEKLKLISEIYPFNSQVLTIAIGNLNINKKRAYSNKGYIPLYGEWQNELDSDRSSEVHEIDTNKVNIFREFLTTAKKLKIKIFVVSSPLFLKQKVNTGIDKCRELCLSEKVPFINLQSDTFFLKRKELFKDILHLNNKGAIEFSKVIANKILHFTPQ